MTQCYELIVIGAGSGGLAAAKNAASLGAKVALIEKDMIGGTCVNLGCVPKKIMWYAGNLVEASHYGHDYGFDFQTHLPDFSTLVSHRQRYISSLNQLYAKQIEQHNIAYIKGQAQFLDQKTIKVNDQFLHGDHIIIATGCSPVMPDMPGAEFCIDSNGFFALTSVPKKIALIGAGYVATELASILNLAGAKVSLLLRYSTLLRDFDSVISDSLMKIMSEQGINILPNHPVDKVTRDNHGLLSLHCHNKIALSELDCVLYAIGRKPRSKDLNLSAAGVRSNKEGFIHTNKWETTNIGHIYAIGDVTGKRLLTPVAVAAGRRLTQRLFGTDKKAHVDYRNIPSVIFTHPPIGSVGLSEQAAIEKYGRDQLTIHETQFNSLFYGISKQKIPSQMKLITLKPNEKIIGCHIVGNGADEMLQGFAVALKMGATKKDFDNTMAIHPTNAEEMVLLK
jgi:glutathione reductase (NADPH)